MVYKIIRILPKFRVFEHGFKPLTEGPRYTEKIEGSAETRNNIYRS